MYIYYIYSYNVQNIHKIYLCWTTIYNEMKKMFKCAIFTYNNAINYISTTKFNKKEHILSTLNNEI